MKALRLAGWAKKAATPAALLLSAGLVAQASSAAFSVTTPNTGNAWATGSVTLTDDDAGTAMFAAADHDGLSKNSTAAKCIAVTYTGDANADLRLYGAVDNTNGLGNYLNMQVERGTGGGFGSCAGFTPAATIFNANLSTWAAADFSSGLGSSAVVGDGTAKTVTYRFTYTVANNDAAAGKGVTADFTWEAVTV